MGFYLKDGTKVDMNEVNWDVYDLVDKKLVFKDYGTYDCVCVSPPGEHTVNQLVFTKN